MNCKSDRLAGLPDIVKRVPLYACSMRDMYWIFL